MALNDPIANALSLILNAEKIGRNQCTLKNVSKLLRETMEIFVKNGYVGEANVVETTKGAIMEIKLAGTINKCGVVKPRFAVQKDNFEKFEKRYLPARNMGILIISTSQGLMTHREAKEKQIGGKLVAYCY